MDWIVDFIFNPVTFFDRAKKEDPSLILVLGGFFTCLILYTTGHLILIIKNVEIFNRVLENTDITIRINKTIAYGISIFGSINYWLIWILGISYFICIDILYKDRKNYLLFVKLAGLSFYCMIPYLVVVFFYSIFYTPENLPIPLEYSFDSLTDWAFEASQQIRSGTIYTLIGNLEYFFDIWLLTLLTASYKSYSKQSFLFCIFCGLIFMAMIISFEIII